MKQYGFTLVEMMLSVAFVSIVSLMGYVALHTASTVSVTSNTKTETQTSVRDAMIMMTAEIEQAAKAETAQFFPGVNRIEVLQDGVPQIAGAQGNAIRFQVPLDTDGLNWSTPIQFRFLNEDDNANGFLEQNEDTAASGGDTDGTLSRRILREQDLNGDGDFDDPGETRVVGSANDLANVTFTLNNDRTVLSIGLVSTRSMQNRTRTVSEFNEATQQMETIARADQANSSATTQVYILN